MALVCSISDHFLSKLLEGKSAFKAEYKFTNEEYLSFFRLKELYNTDLGSLKEFIELNNGKSPLKLPNGVDNFIYNHFYNKYKNTDVAIKQTVETMLKYKNDIINGNYDNIQLNNSFSTLFENSKIPIELVENNSGALGYVKRNKIYLTKNPSLNTLVHEYTHLWAKSALIYNPNFWNNLVQELKKCKSNIWNEVVLDSNYANISTYENAIASEVLARLSGNKAESILQRENRSIIGKLKSILNKFWTFIKENVFNISTKDIDIDRLPYVIINDLINNTDLKLNELEYIGINEELMPDNVSLDTINNVLFPQFDSILTSKQDNYNNALSKYGLTKESIAQYVNKLGAYDVYGWLTTILNGNTIPTIDLLLIFKNKLEYESYNKFTEYLFAEKDLETWSGNIKDIDLEKNQYVYLTGNNSSIETTGKNNALLIKNSIPLELIRSLKRIGDTIESTLVSVADGAETIRELYALAKDNTDTTYYVDIESFILDNIDLDHLENIFKKAGVKPLNVLLSSNFKADVYVDSISKLTTWGRDNGDKSNVRIPNDLNPSRITIDSEVAFITKDYTLESIECKGSVNSIFYNGILSANSTTLPSDDKIDYTLESYSNIETKLGKFNYNNEDIKLLYKNYFNLYKTAIQKEYVAKFAEELNNLKGKHIVGYKYSNIINAQHVLADLVLNSAFVNYKGGKYLVIVDRVYKFEKGAYKDITYNKNDADIVRTIKFKSAIINNLLIPIDINNNKIYVAKKADKRNIVFDISLFNNHYLFDDSFKPISEESVSKEAALLIKEKTSRILPSLILTEFTIESELNKQNCDNLQLALDAIYKGKLDAVINSSDEKVLSIFNETIFDVIKLRNDILARDSIIENHISLCFTGNDQYNTTNKVNFISLNKLFGIRSGFTANNLYVSSTAPIFNYDTIIIRGYDTIPNEFINKFIEAKQIKPSLLFIFELEDQKPSDALINKLSNIEINLTSQYTNDIPIVKYTQEDAINLFIVNQNNGSFKIITSNLDLTELNNTIHYSLRGSYDLQENDVIRFTTSSSKVQKDIDYKVIYTSREFVKFPKFKSYPFSILNNTNILQEATKVTLAKNGNINDVIDIYLVDPFIDTMDFTLVKSLIVNGKNIVSLELLKAYDRNDVAAYQSIMKDLDIFRSTVSFINTVPEFKDLGNIWDYAFAITPEQLKGNHYDYIMCLEENDINNIKQNVNNAILLESNKSDTLPNKKTHDVYEISISTNFDLLKIKQNNETGIAFNEYKENKLYGLSNYKQETIAHAERIYKILPQLFKDNNLNPELNGVLLQLMVDTAVYEFMTTNRLAFDNIATLQYMYALLLSLIPANKKISIYDLYRNKLNEVAAKFLNLHGQLRDLGYSFKNSHISLIENAREENGHFDIKTMLGGLDLNLDLDDLMDVFAPLNFDKLINKEVKPAEVVAAKMTNLNVDLPNGLLTRESFVEELTTKYTLKKERYFSPNILKLSKIKASELFIRNRNGGFSIVLVNDISNNQELKTFGTVQLDINSNGYHKQDGYKLPESKFHIRKLSRNDSAASNFTSIIIEYNSENKALIILDIKNILESLLNIDSIVPQFDKSIQYTDALKLLDIAIDNTYINSYKNKLIEAKENTSIEGLIKLINSIIISSLEEYIRDMANNYYISYLMAKYVISTRLPSQGLASVLDAIIAAYTDVNINDVYVNRWLFWLLGSDLDKSLFK